MVKQAAKFCLLLFGVLIVTVAAALAYLAGLIWRAESGTVRVDQFAPLIEAGCALSSPNVAKCDVRTVLLSQRLAERSLDVTVEGVELLGADGEPIASFARGVFGFDADDLFAARFGPQSLLVEEAVLRIVRTGAEPLGERRLDLDYGSDFNGASGVFESLTGGPYMRKAFQIATLTRTKIEFFDEASGGSWTAQDAEAKIEKTATGYSANVYGNFDMGAGRSKLDFAANYDVAADLIVADVDVVDAPIVDIVKIFIGASPDQLTSPVTGRGAISISGDGAVISSQISGQAGRGVLQLGGIRTDVESMALEMNFDASRNQFLIKSFDLDAAMGGGRLAGEIGLTGDRFAPSGLAFRLQLEDGRVNAPGAFEAPLELGAVNVVGEYAFETRRASISSLALGVFGATISGGLGLDMPAGRSVGLTGALAVEGALPKAEVMQLWPKGAAWAARRFVAEQVIDGVFDQVSVNIDLPAGTMDGGAIMPDDALTLAFRARDASLIYAPGMTPLTEMTGLGVLRGNSFRFDVSAGRVGAVTMREGVADMPVLRPKGHPAVFSFTAAGDARDILTVLNQKPLAVLQSTAFTPDQFEGLGVVEAKISRPNQRDVPRQDYRYEAAAKFDDFIIRDVLESATFVGSRASVDLDYQSMSVSGAGEIGGSPVRISWRQKFYGEGDRTVIRVDGGLDSQLGDLLGLPLRQFVRGAAPFVAEARGDLAAIREVDLTADFREAALVADAFAWRKPVGEPAIARTRLAFEDGRPSSATVNVTGPRVRVQGSLDFAADGALANVGFDRLRLEEAFDLGLSAARDDAGDLEIVVSGRQLKLGRLIDQIFSKPSGGESEALDLSSLFASTSISARIDEVHLRGGEIWRDASLDFAHGAERLDALAFVALDIDGGRFSLDLAPDAAAENERKLVARAEDLGAVLGALFNVNAVRGGRSVVEFSLDAGEPVGVLEAQDFQIVNMPLLARIFAAGSFLGLTDLMTGEGIQFEQAFADFSFDRGELTLEEFRAAGPSVGLSAGGSVSFGVDGAVNLAGAVAPAYQINSFLGKAPLIGDLFVNRSGEGVIALSYAVTGAPSEPTIAVNPLSALTPGVMRRMFETPPESMVEEGN